MTIEDAANRSRTDPGPDHRVMDMLSFYGALVHITPRAQGDIQPLLVIKTAHSYSLYLR
jgi:hypothetical protein